jgi:protein-S-isoprenylcysteine O-methyltransferase Ste14
MDARIAIYGIWMLWIASWIAAALWTNRTVKRPELSWRSLYRVPEVLGFALLLGFFGRIDKAGHFHGLEIPILWPVPPVLAGLMVLSCAAGFAFAWWARLHLGRLWSGTVTRKEGHRVVDSGPYRFVRHPIYTGILLSAFATAIEQATPPAVAGALLLLFGFWIKARLEENFLRSELGADAYDAYARRTAMLVPFVKVQSRQSLI